MMEKYILQGKEPILEPDLMKWGEWFENVKNRTVKKTEIDDIQISTIFLGIDHSFSGHIPILFETMVFGGTLDQEMDRYSTWEKAEQGHEKMIEKVKKSLRKENNS